MIFALVITIVLVVSVLIFLFRGSMNLEELIAFLRLHITKEQVLSKDIKYTIDSTSVALCIDYDPALEESMAIMDYSTGEGTWLYKEWMRVIEQNGMELAAVTVYKHFYLHIYKFGARTTGYFYVISGEVDGVKRMIIYVSFSEFRIIWG